MYARRLFTASLSILALVEAGFAATPPRAALVILIDASVATTETSLGGLPMVFDALRSEAALTQRDDLLVAVRLYGTKDDDGAPDCTASTLAVPFGPLDAERIGTGLAKVPPSRRVAPLAHAVAVAVADLTAQSARSRHLFIIAGTEDGCGADACGAVSDAKARGVTSAGAIVLTASRQASRNLECLGSIALARDPVGVREALQSVLHDAGASTGIALIHHGDAGRIETVRYSLTPVPPPARTGLRSSSEARDVRGVAPGTYLLDRDDRATPQRVVRITEGNVTLIEEGKGTLLARAENFYGATLRDAALEIRVHDGGTSPVPSSNRAIPHTTLPLHPPGYEEAAPPAVTATDVEPPVAPEVADNAGITKFVRAPLGEPVALDPGVYDLQVSHDGATITMKTEIKSGRRSTATAHFGAMKLTRPGNAVRVRDRAGNLLGIARPGNYVHLPPGHYRLEGGSTSGSSEAEVIAGEVTLIEPGL